MSILLKEKITDSLQGIRQYMQEHQAIMIVLCMILLALAGIIFVVRGLNSSASSNLNRTITKVPFIDLTTGKVFMASATEYPPIISPDGNEAVRIRYYRCAGGDKFIGCYEKYTEKYKKAIKEAATNPDVIYEMDQSGKGILLLSLDGKKWYDSSDPTFNELQEKLLKCPDGKWAVEVLPDE